MKTKVLAVHSIQANMVGAEVSDRVCIVLLSNGRKLLIECKDEKRATDVYNTLMFYPSVGKSNNSVEFETEFELSL